jgi:hypothetical protein
MSVDGQRSGIILQDGVKAAFAYHAAGRVRYNKISTEGSVSPDAVKYVDGAAQDNAGEEARVIDYVAIGGYSNNLLLLHFPELSR